MSLRTKFTGFKRCLKPCLAIAPLTILLSGCPSMVSFLPSMVPSLVPSVNLTSVNVNNNQISCYLGSWFSSEYCSIPIARFLAITTNYADPYGKRNLLLSYGQQNRQLIFADLNEQAKLDKINQSFLANYPDSNALAVMPQTLRKLLIDIKNKYIPNHNYVKLSEAYSYLYTIITLDFATDSCVSQYLATQDAAESQQQLQFMQYKVFSIQFTNAVLMHISSALNSKYDDEYDAYEHLYRQILKLDPYQLDNLADDLYEKTLTYSPPQFESALYTPIGVSFGILGRFSCTNQSVTWLRFGFEFFGTNVSGIKRDISFKSKDIIDRYNDDLIPIKYNSESSVAHN